MMTLRCRELLKDIQDYTEFILEHTRGSDWSFASTDRLTRHAVERGFEVIGIALVRLDQEDEKVATEITEHRTIVAFRNRIAHGYDHNLDASIFDDVVHNHLPVLLKEVRDLLESGS